jgi:UDP-N-acetylenolpyruvoylglucosamine reductase
VNDFGFWEHAVWIVENSPTFWHTLSSLGGEGLETLMGAVGGAAVNGAGCYPIECDHVVEEKR